MRWQPYLILVYVLLGLQMGVGAVLPVNLPLLAVLLACLCAPRDIALTAALIVGLTQDLVGNGPLGPLAVAYGLVGAVCASRRAAPNHPLLHGSLALLAGVIVAVVLAVFAWIRPLAADASMHFGHLLLTAVVTAVFAPLVLGPLVRIMFAFVNKSDKFHMR